MRNLLSTFVDIFNETEDKYTTEDNEEVAEPVTVEATKEEIGAVVNEVEAEAVIAEADILDTDVVYRRPKEKEAILDLSKPEIQDAEMVDDED